MTARIAAIVVLSCLTGIPALPALAVDAPQPTQAAPATAPTGTAYLGVAVEPLHPALAAQLPGLLSKGQGLLVVTVTPGSPAQKAGIAPYDVLLAYDDQKLFSPKQLVKLVQYDEPGRDVAITLIRSGERQGVKVQLASRPQGSAEWRRPEPYWHHGRPEHRWMWHQRPQAAPGFWEAFESLSVKKLEGDRYQADVGYRIGDGTVQRREFQGTLEEIRRQVRADRNLPPPVEAQLLQALAAPGDVMMQPQLWYWPGEEEGFEHGKLEQ
jgi:hypothetical protein